MRIDTQVAAFESETEQLLQEIRHKLAGYRFQHLGTRQFEDVGRVYERRGAPATQVFVKSKMRESRRKEQPDYQQLLDIVMLVSQRKLDVHLKGFILRKLPSILASCRQRQGG
jgi:hypothetical protein